ncbi:DUF4113 domain-containing protein [Methylorubrum extorquens]|uniref:DUF4113 domain-containing protein n=1 Tax=Methylorubrum extorquens TaxID=408 RepID=A0AAX3WG27_METEX|nr:DUF4113 domain-containing protein [Methylorubrum extorquens]
MLPEKPWRRSSSTRFYGRRLRTHCITRFILTWLWRDPSCWHDCNACWGRGAVVPARAGLERQRRDWATKFEMRTPRYTTRVEELPVARA